MTIDLPSEQLEELYSFNPLGRRRSADDWNYTLDANDQALFAGRGFTGHEHIPEFGLINMNGRLYDPLLGRMLSPDNYVQLPDFTQNFNRYSYALNNPLVYTDPSGEIVWAPIIAFAIWSGAVNVATHSQNIDNFWQGLGYFGVGAGVAVAGGVAGQAAAGAVTAGLTGGFLNGVSDYLNGYSFWDGSAVNEIAVQEGVFEKNAVKYNSSLQADVNDGMLKSRLEGEFRVTEGDYNIDKITTKTGTKYGLNNSGKYVNKSGKAVGGYLRRFSTGHSHLHVSPYYTMAGSVEFRAVAGHELIHAYHNFSIPNLSTVYTERVAYNYTYDTYMGAGQWNKAFGVYRTAISHGYWGTYPSLYQIPTPLGW